MWASAVLMRSPDATLEQGHRGKGLWSQTSGRGRKGKGEDAKAREIKKKEFLKAVRNCVKDMEGTFTQVEQTFCLVFSSLTCWFLFNNTKYGIFCIGLQVESKLINERINEWMNGWPNKQTDSRRGCVYFIYNQSDLEQHKTSTDPIIEKGPYR